MAAKGAGDAVIGKVSVKAFPDTKEFPRELKRKLDAIEKRITVNIPAEVNDRVLELSARRAVKEVNAKSAARAAGLVLKIRAEIDDKDLDDRIRRIVAAANKAAKVDVDVKDAVDAMDLLGDKAEDMAARMSTALSPDTQQMLDDIDRATRKVDEALREQFAKKRELKIEADTDHAEKKVKSFWDDWDGKDINFDLAIETATHRWVQGRLAWLARTRQVTLAPMLDNKAVAKVEATLAALAGWRMLDSVAGNLKRMFENIDKNLPLVGTLAMAVMGLSSWLLASASNAFTLARSLAQIAGAGLLLPGLLTGMAFGVGAMVAVLKDFNAVLPGVAQHFSKLQDLMSTDFWSLAGPSIRELTDVLLPRLSTGLRGTAQSLGVYFASLGTSLRVHLGDSMEGMFANLNTSVLLASRSTDAMANSVEILGRRGSEYLPRFAVWINKIVHEFDAWLTKADESGRLTHWIEEGIFELREFGRALGSAGTILANFARAAEQAGGSNLTMFADALERVADITGREPFQSNLVNVLLAAHETMNTIARVSGPAVSSMFDSMSRTFAAGLRTIDNGIGDLIAGIATALDNQAFQSGFVAFLEGIADGVRALQPMWAPMGEALGAIGQMLGVMAANFGPLLASMLTQIAGLVSSVLPSIIPVVENLTGILGVLLDTAGPAIAAIVTALVGLVTPLLESQVAVTLLVGAFAGLKLVSAWGAAITMLQGIRLWAANAVKDLNPLPASLNKAAKAAGAAATALVALATIGNLIGDATSTSVSGIDKFAHAARSAAQPTLTLSENMLQVIDPMAQVNQAFSHDPGKGWVTGVMGISTEVNGLGDALYWLEERNGAETVIYGLADALGMFEDPAKSSAEAVENFDAAMAQLVQEGNLEAAAASVETFRIAAEQQGYSSEWIAQKLGDYNLKLEEHKLAQQVAEDAALRSAAAMDTYNLAIEQSGIVSPGLIQSINDTSKEFIDFSTEVENAEVSLQGWITALEEQVAAQAAWADNMAILTERGVSEGVLAELDRLGPEGALRVAQLTTATDAELAKLEGIFAAKSEGAVRNAESKFGELSSRVTNAMNSLPDDVKAELEELGIVMFDEGGNVVQGMADGMTQKLPTANAAAKELAQGIGTTAANELEINSPSRLFKRFGGFVVDGLVQGLNANSAVTGAMTALASLVTIPNPARLLLDAGKSVISGFISGISSMFGSVQTKLNSLTAMLPDWKGPRSTDQVILREAGQLVIEGFIDGLEDRFRDVRSTLGDLTDMVEGTDIGAPSLTSPDDLVGVSSRARRQIAASAAETSRGGDRILNYHAAPGSSIDSEEDLFAAANRGRMVGF